MKLIVTTPDGGVSEWLVPSDGSCVLVPDDPDNRTQAERNADNAIAAQRLRRVEAHLQQLSAALDGIPGTSKVLVAPLLAKLDEALEARVE